MLGHGRTIWILSWNWRHLHDGLVVCVGKQLVGLHSSVPEWFQVLAQLVDLRMVCGRWILLWEWVIQKRYSSAFWRLALVPFFLQGAHTHRRCLPSWIPLGIWHSGPFPLCSASRSLLTFILPACIYSLFSGLFFHACLSFSLPVFHNFLSMNINAPFDCQHLPFQIQLLASTQGALLNALVGFCCDMFSMYKAKSALNAKLAQGLFGTSSLPWLMDAFYLVHRIMGANVKTVSPKDSSVSSKESSFSPNNCTLYKKMTCCALILLKLTKPTCCLHKTCSGVSSEL